MPPPDPAAGPARVEATVSGWVQGVGYRYFVVRMASRLGLVGWVANRPDGGVECVAEGPVHDLERFVDALRQGPDLADVTGVDVRWLRPSGGFSGFEIRASGHRGD